MIWLFYEFALWLFALFAFPKMLFHMWTKGKYRASFLPKLGFNFPSINKDGRPLIWVHAVSLGETKAVAALAKKLKNAPEKPLLLISSATETGHAEAKRCMAFADYHVFLPFDFSWVINPIVQRAQPDMVVLCETDLWYNFLRAAKSTGASIVVVNAKISERSKERFKLFYPFAKRLFSLVDLFCIQSTHYLERFKELGIDPSKLLVTGNIKFDDEHHRAPPEILGELRNRLALHDEDRVLVIGSSHDPEEKDLLHALKELCTQQQKMKVIIVPRHPERFNEVAGLVQQMGLTLHRYSSPTPPIDPPQIILVDAMGLLRKCYQLADIAIVAGSFTPKVGGHNILEPLYYGVPVIFGPEMKGQPELLEVALEYGAGIQVAEAKDVRSLIEELLNSSERKDRLISAGNKLIEQCKGATQSTYEAIERIIAHKRN